MAFAVADRVKETTSTTGTGTIALAGAEIGFEGFVSAIGDGNNTYYAIIDNDNGEWEVGVGTVTDATPDTLSRDTVLSSSNSDAKVNFQAGTKQVFVTQPAGKSVYQDNDSGTVTLDKVQLDLQSVHPSYSEGLLWYDSIHNTLNYYGDEPGLVHEVGLEEHQKVYNNSGVTIAKGEPLYFSGNFNGYPTAARANSTDVNKYNAQGIAAHSIENNSYGYVCTAGLVEGVDTSGLTAGTNFFVGLTDGAVQNASPTYPNFPMCLGWVVSSDSTDGILLVNQQNHSVNSFRVRTDTHIGGDLIIDGDLTVVGSQTVASSTNVETGAPFLYLNSGDTIGEANTTFTGSGLDDAYFAGHFSGTASTTYYVKIDATGTPDTFSWSKDNFSTTEATGVSITGGEQTLDNGIKIDFGATTGHTLNDVWSGAAAPLDVDTGFWSNRNTGGSGVGYTHVGLFFDVTDSKFKLVDEYDPEPTGTINTGDSSFSVGTLVVDDIEGVDGTLSGALSVTGNITVGGTVDGRDIATDGTKLDGIEANATADQTAAEIKTAYESNSDTNAFTDTLLSKLNAIDTNATPDQTAADIRGLGFFDTSNDGSGSGLDADLLDGNHASAFATLSGSAFTGQVSVSSGTYPPLSVTRDAGSNTTGNYGALKLNTSTTGTPANGLGTYAGFFVDNTLKGSVGFENNGTFYVINASDTSLLTVDGSGNVTVGGTVDGRDLATDGTKLDGIESGATADQTAAEIKTAYESNSDTNAFTNALISKLNGIETGATTDQTAAEIRTLVESATNSNVFTDADHTKLNGIESGATADQTASEILTAIKTVDGAGSGLDADTLDGQQGSYYYPASNPNGYTTNTGDITGVTAGSYLTGGGTSGGVTLNVDATTAATANKVVARNSSGDDYRRYGFASYFNMSHGTGTNSADTIFYSSTDNYIRKNTATGMRASLSVPTRTGGDASGTWGISITGNADTVDSLHASSFLRSDAADTCSGDISFTGGAGAITITNSDIRSNASSNWTGNPGSQGKIQYHSNRWYIVSDSSSNRIVQFRRDGTDRSYIDNNGKFMGDTDLLDGQHGSYYLNYNNFSNTPVIPPAANNATITLSAGTGLSGGGNFTTNQSSAETITFNLEAPYTYIDQATGNYGTIKVDDDRGVTWAGYAIRDDWVFMSNGAGNMGLYNDTDNEWVLYAAQNSWTRIYHNGSTKIETVNNGIKVLGAGTSSCSIELRGSDDDLFGYVHGSDSSYIGFLDDDGSWAYQHLKDTHHQWYINSQQRMFLDNSTLKLNTTNDEKISLEGTSNPLIRWCESSTDRAYIQYVSGTNAFRFRNQETGLYDMMSSSSSTAINVRYMGSDGDVWGSVYATNNQEIGFLDEGGSWAFKIVNDSRMEFRIGAQEEMRLESDGDLHVEGDVIAFSTTVSDRRLKENIKNIENALDKVDQINGVTFLRKANGQESAGVIAQEIMEVLPEAVKEKALPLLNENPDEKYYVVEYDAVTGLLVEAVKELSAKVKALETK